MCPMLFLHDITYRPYAVSYAVNHMLNTLKEMCLTFNSLSGRYHWHGDIRKKQSKGLLTRRIFSRVRSRNERPQHRGGQSANRRYGLQSIYSRSSESVKRSRWPECKVVNSDLLSWRAYATIDSHRCLTLERIDARMESGARPRKIYSILLRTPQRR